MRSRLNRQYLPTRKAGSSPEPASICTMRCDTRSSWATLSAVSTSSDRRDAPRPGSSPPRPSSSRSPACRPSTCLSAIPTPPVPKQAIASARSSPAERQYLSWVFKHMSFHQHEQTKNTSQKKPPQGEKAACQTILRSPLVIRSSSARSFSCRYSFSLCQKLSPG